MTPISPSVQVTKKYRFLELTESTRTKSLYKYTDFLLITTKPQYMRKPLK